MIRAVGSVDICHGPNGVAVGPIDRLIEKECHVQVFVRDNNVDQALKALKRKMQREGVFREMKLRVGITKNPPRGESAKKRKLSVAPGSSPAKSCSAKVCCR